MSTFTFTDLDPNLVHFTVQVRARSGLEPVLGRAGLHSGAGLSPKWMPNRIRDGYKTGPELVPKLDPEWIQNRSRNGSKTGPGMDPKPVPFWGHSEVRFGHPEIMKIMKCAKNPETSQNPGKS